MGALYEGILPMSVEAMGKYGVRYGSFQMFSQAWKKNIQGTEDARTPVTVAGNLVSGMSAGIVESYVIVIPCELLKIRQMSSTAGGDHAFFKLAGEVVSKEGFAGLYKGGMATAMRQSSNHAIRFPVFLYVTGKLKGGDATTVINPMYNFLAGGFAGCVSTLANTPLDVLKSRMQATTYKGEAQMQIMRDVVAADGVKGLWKGVVPRLLRVGPGQAITWVVVQAVSEFLSTSS